LPCHAQPHRSPQAETHYRLPRETFGMLRIRRFSLTLICDPCRSSTTINLVERPELTDVEVGSVDFACPRCSRTCHYELKPPHQAKKRLLHEQAIGCRGPADYDPKPFVGPFPLLSEYGDQLIGDFAARGLCLLATCPGGRERLIDHATPTGISCIRDVSTNFDFGARAADGGQAFWPCRPGIAGMA
jgi:hypothetical protein